MIHLVRHPEMGCNQRSLWSRTGNYQGDCQRWKGCESGGRTQNRIEAVGSHARAIKAAGDGACRSKENNSIQPETLSSWTCQFVQKHTTISPFMLRSDLFRTTIHLFLYNSSSSQLKRGRSSSPAFLYSRSFAPSYLRYLIRTS